MQTNIQQWGNSLGIRISKNLASKLQIKKGAIVDLEISGNHLIITPKATELEMLVNNITDLNRHNEEFSDDNTRGNELW